MAFWQTKALSEMTDEEWESLCDGCAKCCLHKLEDEESGDIYYTNVACRQLNLDTCRCTHYAERTRLVPECLDLKKLEVSGFHWLPQTCAYRLVWEGKPLPDWHPLVSGRANSVISAGVSIRGYAVREEPDIDYENHLIEQLL